MMSSIVNGKCNYQSPFQKFFQKSKRAVMEMSILAICALIILLGALLALYYIESEDDD